MTESASNDVGHLVSSAAAGNGEASAQLLPLVYQELRRIAAAQMRDERVAQTLQTTALVHEAYLRLIGSAGAPTPEWKTRGHFFAAAATAMRRILVDRARARGRLKRGGGAARVPLPDVAAPVDSNDIDFVSLDAALAKLDAHDPAAAQVVMLRYFAGLSIEETTAAMDLGVTSVKAKWNYAKTWLFREMATESADDARGGNGDERSGPGNPAVGG